MEDAKKEKQSLQEKVIPPQPSCTELSSKIPAPSEPHGTRQWDAIPMSPVRPSLHQGVTKQFLLRKTGQFLLLMPCACPARCRSCCLPAAALGLGHARVLGLQGSASHCLGVEKVFPCVALRTGTFSSSLGRCGWVLLCLSAAAAPLSWSACINFHHMSNPIKLSALLERG